MRQTAPRPVWRDRAAGIVDDLERYQDTPNLVTAQVRRQRLAERLHSLGARVTFELLDELAREHRIGNDIDECLSRYARLEPDVLAAVGADRFPVLPIHKVSQ